MIVKRTFRYRLYPSRETEKKMLDTLEACRHAYNEMLGTRIETHRQAGVSLSKFGLNKCINYAGIDTKNVHSQVLQNVNDRIGKAFDNFFRRCREKKAGKHIKVGYPRFKGRDGVKSFTYPQNGYSLRGNVLRLSKIGEVNLRIGRTQNRMDGHIKTLTVKRMPSGKWFAIFSCETSVRVRKRHDNTRIGVDVGLTNFATLSDGTEIENHRFLVKSERRLKKLGRRLSRKDKGSVGRKKARLRLARMHEHIANQRHDFMHKTTRMLVDRFGLIVIEDLSIKGMVRHPYLAKHIHDASWGNFGNMLGYKAERAGSRVDRVDPRGTTQRCSQCGANVPKMLAVRWHMCPVCGLHIGRDLNSAKDILKQATAGTAGSHADGDRSSPLGAATILEGSLSRKSEATQLVVW